MDVYGFERVNASKADMFGTITTSAIGGGFFVRPSSPLYNAECGCGARDWDYDVKGRMRCGYCRSLPREVARKAAHL